jgi:phosphate-selective porin OprO/OprP
MRSWLMIFCTTAALAQEASPSPVPVPPKPAAPMLSGRELIRLLTERVAKLEAAQAKAEARANETPIISFGSTGMVLRTPDGKTTIQTRGLVQADGRLFLGDDKHALTDTFLLRRVRPSIDATFFGWLEARLMPDFGQNKAYLQEAYVDLKPWKWLALIGGKLKPPVGLERLQTEASTKFIERALPTNLVPSRDVGAELHGTLSFMEYQVGVFNGVVDGADQPDVDVHDGKELEARVFFHPLRPLDKKWFNHLGIGLAGTYGKERGTASAPNVASYKTPGQNTFFTYYSDTTKPDGFVFANGDRWRVSPQMYYFGGPVGFIAEYVRSGQELQRGAAFQSVWSDAWQIQLSALLTPHDENGYQNVVISRPLEWKQHGYGAFEVVLRYHEQHIESSVFPRFADPNTSARQARAFGVGLNWYANRFFRAALDYDRTDFVGGGAGGTDRAPENALMARMQAVF